MAQKRKRRAKVEAPTVYTELLDSGSARVSLHPFSDRARSKRRVVMLSAFGPPGRSILGSGWSSSDPYFRSDADAFAWLLSGES